MFVPEDLLISCSLVSPARVKITQQENRLEACIDVFQHKLTVVHFPAVSALGQSRPTRLLLGPTVID